jgi:hypothetical protein
VLHEVQTEPGSLGKVYALGVRAGGARVGCGDYELSLDGAATRAFAVEGCDVNSAETRLRVVDRSALFDLGDVVPRPRAVTVSAVVRQTTTATGGGAAPTAGSKIWCSVALEPYLWDGLRGVAVALPPDRFELVPLDERVRAAPDGSGWVAHLAGGVESQMDIYFRYQVIDRATGKKVLEDVATLTCADRTAAAAMAPMPRRDLEEVVPIYNPPLPPLPLVDETFVPPRRASFMSLDIRFPAGGVILGAQDLQQELAGLQLGLGKHVSDRWYVGGTARFVLTLDQGDSATASPLTGIFQFGPEVRYAFYRTEARKPRGAQSAFWLGLRSGLEDVGPGTLGGFAALGLGWDITTGRVAFGTVLETGAGFDAPGAYGDDSVVHPSIDFSVRVGFDL